MRTSEDRSGPLVTCTGNTCRSPVLTGELVPVDWHGLPVQVTNSPDRSSEVLIGKMQQVIVVSMVGKLSQLLVDSLPCGAT